MSPVRKVQSATHFKKITSPDREDPSVLVPNCWTPCSNGDAEAVEMSWMQGDTQYPGKLVEPKVDFKDMRRAMYTTKPSVGKDDLEELQKFTLEFGQEG
jgi:vacuolar protein-sorting-associated protein 4